MTSGNYPPKVNSPEEKDWKKRLKSLGIVRGRGKRGEKKEEFLRREEGEGGAVASGQHGGEAARSVEPAASSLFEENSPRSLRTLQKVNSGREGEDIACALLAENSLLVLDRNVRYRDGEIDIVALDGATTVFVEVKRRRDVALGTPAEAVTRTKRARVVRAARRWLAAHPGRAGSVRFDVVAVRDDSPAVEWLRGAFDASR
jgi:putative endonuclease